jgi:hypothetical protein
MKSAATSFKGGTLPTTLQAATGGAIPPELRRLCETFIELQQARHEADYDLTREFTRREAQDLVTRAERAFQDWTAVSGTPSGDAFLVALLLRKKLDR